MSHSQFHSTNLFILRHAWLNLWDKHMTTGRINQVTTFLNAKEHNDTPKQKVNTNTNQVCSWPRVHQLDWIDLNRTSKGCLHGKMHSDHFNDNIRPPWISISHISDTLPHVHRVYKLNKQRSWSSVKTTSNPQHLKDVRGHGGSPSG
jgi:hypothetical protein